MKMPSMPAAYLLGLLAIMPVPEARSFEEHPGDLRLRATFAEGKPEVDFGPGEQRISRIRGGSFSGHLGSVPPWAGAVTTEDCMVPGAVEGGFAVAPKTDLALRGLGVLNAQSGTFAFRLQRSRRAERGGPIFSAIALIPGGPTLSVAWVLGMGGGSDSNAPPGHLYVSTTTPPWVQCVTDAPVPADDWIHVAAVWDTDTGAKLYVNGQEAGAAWGEGATHEGFTPSSGVRNYASSRDAVPVPVERIHLHRDPQGGAVTDIHVFDAPLAAEEIARLARGETVEPGGPWRIEATEINREARMRWLGWGSPRVDGDLIALAPGQPVTVREQWAERAYEDLRAAGFLAIDGIATTQSLWHYHGYAHLDPRTLHLVFPHAIRANYLVARGDMPGTLFAGGTRDEPLSGEPFLDLSRRPMISRQRLDPEFHAATATFRYGAPQGRALSGLHFYRVAEGSPAMDPSRIYPLHGQAGGGLPLGEWKRQEFISSYGHADRRFRIGNAEPAGVPVEWPMPALRAHHFFTPVLAEDFPLAGIGLRLRLRGMGRPTRMQVRLHDAFDPWRERSRWDFLLSPAPGGEGVYETSLLLRKTLALENEATWVTVLFDRDVVLLSGPDGGESALLFYEADRSAAQAGFLEWQLAGWRTAFEDMSEPRPWGMIGADPESGWWLRAAAPPYEHMDRVGRELLRRYPDDPRVQSWFAFITPMTSPNPWRRVEPPEAGPHPRWAVLARANLHWYAGFVDGWTDNRHHPETGEFGHWVGDDTDLLQDWPDLALIDDPGGRLREVVRQLAHGVSTGAYRVGVENGLNRRFTDALHAYEDGMNMQPMDFLLDYGNPVKFHRLLETAARYDGFLLTPPEDGMRRFNSSGTGRAYWGTDPARPPEGSPFDGYWRLATHAGQVLLWYNGSPPVAQMFAEVAEWLFASGDEARALLRSDLMLALWLHSGDDRYLADWVDSARLDNDRILSPPEGYRYDHWDSTFVRRLPEGLFDPAATVAHSRATAGFQGDGTQRFTDFGTRRMGGDRSYQWNWFEWLLSRDKAYLEEGLAALYQRLTFTMPALTVAEQSGDRVAIPKQLISLMYLGGIPVVRNAQFTPMYAASYAGLGRDFAALVLEDSEDLLRILFYSFAEEPLQGTVTAWGIGPGDFEIAGGPDRTGDDGMDAVEHRRDAHLVRGDAFDIAIPPEQLYIWEARRTRTGVPLHKRPDLAVTGDDAVRHEGGALTVRVHNIGAVASPPTTLALLDREGRAVAVRDLPAIEPPIDLQPKTVEMTFDADEIARGAGDGNDIRVAIDPGGTIEEITRRNNQARIDL